MSQINVMIDQESIGASDEEKVSAASTKFILDTTKTGIELQLRPVKIGDVNLLQNFFSSLSTDSLYSRYHSARKIMSYEQLQNFITIDYRKEMIILALANDNGIEEVVGMGEYRLTEKSLMADIALMVRDDYQNMGIGRELFNYLTKIAQNTGILGFTAEVLADNTSVSRMSERMGIKFEKEISQGISKLSMLFETKIT
ncbi:MAG: GNAT family N-acetyltransferase [Candidatus Marinimicrobia bacterium]|nr:GNAT family N-acetyltransferase [Candidatus Neomarinimicrobiota bacterium]